MKLPNESNFLSRIPTPVLVGIWLLAAVMAGGCLFWALFAPSSSGNQAASVSATSTRVVRRTSTPTTASQPAATVAPTSKPATSAPSNPSNATPAKATKTPRPTATPTTLPINETFGYGIQVNGLNDGSAPESSLSMVQQVKMNWIKQQVRWADFEVEKGAIKEESWAILDRTGRQGETGRDQSDAQYRQRAQVVASQHRPRPDGRPLRHQSAAGRFERLCQLCRSGRGPLQSQEDSRSRHRSLERAKPHPRVAHEPAKDRRGALHANAQADLQVVKAKDPNIVVISGALSPTGCDDGVTCVDDFKYLEQMVSLGLVGQRRLHRRPPQRLQSSTGRFLPGCAQAPKAATAIFRGPFDNPHHSWSFYTTLQRERADRQEAKAVVHHRVRLAQLRGHHDAGAPGFEFSKDNTLQDQANYIVKAFKLMKQWGFVKIAFLWNLNFFTVTEDASTTDNAIYSILNSNGMPRPAFDALGAMPKQ